MSPALGERREEVLRKRVSVLVAVAVIVLSMFAASAMAFAGTFSGNGTNFGQCASAEARLFPPGPAHGIDMSLARFFNPHGLNLQCPKAFTGNP
jgi:ABC-type phosphate/phosphonate transport system permease subunit